MITQNRFLHLNSSTWVFYLPLGNLTDMELEALRERRLNYFIGENGRYSCIVLPIPETQDELNELEDAADESLELLRQSRRSRNLVSGFERLLEAAEAIRAERQTDNTQGGVKCCLCCRVRY